MDRSKTIWFYRSGSTDVVLHNVVLQDVVLHNVVLHNVNLKPLGHRWSLMFQSIIQSKSI